MFDAQSHLMDLKGKSYLQVMWRLVWFREDHPLWAIDTKLEAFDKEVGHAIFSAKILDENGLLKSAARGSESVKDFRDYIEKAETKAVGRALAMLGYGTQFAPELDEGERIVDSPVPKKKKPAAAVVAQNTEDDPLGLRGGKEAPGKYKCLVCGKPFIDTEYDGKLFTAGELYRKSTAKYGQPTCAECAKKYADKGSVDNVK